MFVFQFTTIVYTSGKISLHIFQLVCHAYQMSSVYIWIPYSRTIFKYSGTSLLRSPTGLGKSDLYGEVTLLQGVICTVEYNLGQSHGDCNGEVFLLVR